MPRSARLASLCVAAFAALVAVGCGNKEESVTRAETEGIYVTVDELKYQIQISRILNPASPEDQAYLRGVPEGEDLGGDEVWYGVFVRVENDSDEPHPMAEEYHILDTQENEFAPVELDPEDNAFAYEPRELGAGELSPGLDSPASDNTIRGNLVLFKVSAAALANRPLEFEIESPSGGEGAVVDIDV